MQLFDGMAGSPDMLRRAIFSQQLPAADVKRYLGRMRHESQRALFDLSWPQHFWIERTTIPVQVIGGADDLFFPPSLVEETANLHAVEAEIIPGMAHAVMLDMNWEQAAQRLAAWLERSIS
jgi:pimeloyl-ACP methyl ester carboxylesterase